MRTRRHARFSQQEDPWANPLPPQPDQIDVTPGYEPELQRLVNTNPLPVITPDSEPEVIYGQGQTINLGGLTKFARPAFFAYLLLNDELPTIARAASGYFLWQWFKGEGAPVAEEIEASLPSMSRYRRWR